MISDVLNTISPANIGSDMIDVSVDPSSEPLMVGKVITLNFGYTRTKPHGVVKPLKLQLQPAFGDGSGYFEVVFDLFTPQSYAFKVASAGQYLVIIRETGHNLWQGRILLDVIGDQYQEIRSER